MTRDAAPRTADTSPAIGRDYSRAEGRAGVRPVPFRRLRHGHPEQIKDKVNKYAFSGGRLRSRHREKAATEVDISWKWPRLLHGRRRQAEDDRRACSSACAERRDQEELVCLTP